jgi:hypothetical protein
MKCSIHSTKDLIPKKTKFGTRSQCPVGGCTVVSWNGNPPADCATRGARIAAHESFDKIWQSGALTRSQAYKRLSDALGLRPTKTHICQFEMGRCLAVQRFAYEFLRNVSDL